MSLLRILALSLSALSALCGCSVKRLAVNQLGNALAESGGTYASDDDPELIRAAVPFSLKLMESLLEEDPNHKGLLLASARGFTQFAFAFLQQDAEMVEAENLATAESLRQRARSLYLRARDYGLRGLEQGHRGFGAALRKDPRDAVRTMQKKEVPLLYWTALAWGAAISVSKDNPQLIGEQVMVESLIDRALELQETFNRGAIHSFLITYEMSRPDGKGDPADRARQHFERAQALSNGLLASPYVAYAEAVMVQKQDPKQFKLLLEQALAINPDALPECRLENLIMQKRARWLLSRLDELFLISDNP